MQRNRRPLASVAFLVLLSPSPPCQALLVNRHDVGVAAFGWGGQHRRRGEGHYHPVASALDESVVDHAISEPAYGNMVEGAAAGGKIEERDGVKAKALSSSIGIGTSTSTPDDTLVRLSHQVRSLTKIVLHQQRQLDELQETLRTSTRPPATLFVDGTWLYYSLHERTTIANHFRIPQWHHHYAVDWQAVLKMLNREFNVNIQAQYVYTSAKADTAKDSPRYLLFESLREAGFNVDMKETVGTGEKCVDIKLATEMIAQDYSIGIILTGDMDFLPALALCRQKQGKKIGLFSMREGCNRALYELDHVRDFDVVWLEDHIKEVFFAKSSSGITSTLQQISPVDLAALDTIYRKVTYDFIKESGVAQVHARDLGRHFKKFRLLANLTILDMIKSYSGSLTNFVVAADDAFVVEFTLQDSDKWMVSWNESCPPPLELFSSIPSESTDFLVNFRDYYTDQVVKSFTKDKAGAFEFTYETLREKGVLSIPGAGPTKYDESMKKTELEKACKDLGLSKRGTKVDLIARLTDYQASLINGVVAPSPVHQYLFELIINFVKSQDAGRIGSRVLGRFLAKCKPHDDFHPNALAELKALYGSLRVFIDRSIAQLKTVSGDAHEFMVVFTGPLDSSRPVEVATEASSQDMKSATYSHLKGLLETYLLANGGTMWSRDIGRYLAGCDAYNKIHDDALAELKVSYGSLIAFVEQSDGHFKNNGVVRGKEFSVSVQTADESVVSS
jgi:uncharacterized LabA/DUF88 family protein